MKLKAINLAIMAALATNAVMAEETSPVTANIGVTSNYIWRGVTQTQNDPAIQGGVDFAHESGFSLGTWLSNVDFGTDDPNYELDIYAGYEEKLGDFSFKLSTGYYLYPDGKDLDMWDITPSFSWNFLTVGVAYTLYGEAEKPAAFREGDLYYYGGLTFDLPVNFKLGGTLGYYDFDDLGKEGDYTHWQVSISKSAGDFGTFSLNYDQTDGGDGDFIAIEDDPQLSVGWKKTF
jgi:uncharacterized protein (TIGR02001 family)